MLYEVITFGFGVNVFLVRPVPFTLLHFKSEISIGDAVFIKTDDIRILDIGLVYRNFRHTDPVLLAGADSNCTAVLDIKDRV